VKNECPVCKASNRGKRSGEAAPHLDELVRAYKGIGRAFGFAPLVYGKGIVMTQLDPEENGGHDTESEEEEEDGKMPAVETDEARKKRDSNVHDIKQHLQVCQAVHTALLEQTESQLQNNQPANNRREEIENQNRLRRYQQMVKEQEAVVAVDEQAFNKVRRTKQMVAAKTAKFIAETSNAKAAGRRKAPPVGNARSVENNESAMEKSEEVDEPKTAAMPSDGNADGKIGSGKTEASVARGKEVKLPEMENKASSATDNKLEQPKAKKDESTANEIVSGKSEIAAESGEAKKSETANNKASPAAANNETEQAKAKQDELTVDEEEFCTAPDESQSVEYNTAREESQETSISRTLLNATAISSPTPTMIHDGNTVKKVDHRPEKSSRASSKGGGGVTRRDTCVFDGERSPVSSKAPSTRRRSLRSATRSGSLRAASSGTSVQARESTATATTGRSNSSSPIVLHDGNTVRKIRHNDGPKKSGISSLLEQSKFDSNDPTPRRSGKMSPLPAVALAVKKSAAAEKNDETVVDIGGGARPIDGDNLPAPKFGVAAAAAAASVVEHHAEGEQEKEQTIAKGTIVVVQARTSAKKDETVDLDDGAGDNLPAPKLEVAPAAAPAASSAPPVKHNTEEQYKEQTIAKGTIVVVQARTWPGINKPGGVARVTKVHPAAVNGNTSTKYDVTYVLGGKEKRVDESFVTLHEVEALETIHEEECPDDSRRMSRGRGSMSAEKKSRSIRPRKAAVKTEPKSSPGRTTSIPIYNDEELKHIPADVLKWAGIAPKEKKAKVSKAEGGGKKEAKTPRGKKRVLTESNNANAKSKRAKKKQKNAAAATAARPPAKKEEGGGKSLEQDNHPSNAVVEGLREVIGPLSKEEMAGLADARYYSLLSLDRKPSKSDTLILHAVTSSLTDKDSDMLASLCKILKGKNVILKIMKDFNPNKTQLCITAAASSPKTTAVKKQQKEPIVDVISKSRTLKVMRSALAGIPILTPQWMESCLKEGHMVAPSGHMCIRTLPRKQVASSTDAGGEERDDVPTEHFGVAKYAAAFQKISLSISNNHLLSGVSVLLCGSSAGSGMSKDLKVLLQQAGASIISSVSMASRLLTDIMSKDEEESGSTSSLRVRRPLLVFLCDDSLTDKSCGISDALFQQAKKLIVTKKEASVVSCVHFNWLFDSISCVTTMKAYGYEPLAPRSKALWDLTTEKMETTVADAGSNRNESQVY